MKQKIKRIFITALCIALSLSTIFLTTSCSLLNNGIVATNLQSGYKRRATSEGCVTKELIESITDFSYGLYHSIIAKDNKNKVVSPLTAYVALAVIANGAEGETKVQIEEALGLTSSELNKGLYAYIKNLEAGTNGNVNVANSIWVRHKDDAVEVNPVFLQKIRNWYDIDIYESNFDNQTLKDIEQWGHLETDEQLSRMVNALAEYEVFMSLNTLYFNIDWKNAYPKDKIFSQFPFTSYSGEAGSVTIMYSEEYRYLSGEEYEGVIKNYKDSRFSFILLLPNEKTDFYEFAQSITANKVSNAISSETERQLGLFLPVFSCQTDVSIKDYCKEIGITDIFKSDADLSKITDDNRYNVNKLNLTSYISITPYTRENNKNTRFSIMDWIMGQSEKRPEVEPWSAWTQTDANFGQWTFEANRPFVYIILDEYNVPLFIGYNVSSQ